MISPRDRNTQNRRFQIRKTNWDKLHLDGFMTQLIKVTIDGTFF